MHLWWITLTLIGHSPTALSQLFGTYPTPPVEIYHYPGHYTTAMTVFVNGTDTEIMSTEYTPDYRVEEKMYTVHSLTFFQEQERPYRISPIYKQTYYYPSAVQAGNLGCYCCTTYRKYIVLATCAVITTRHILTTANPTILILRSYGHELTLNNILGGWYELNANDYNVSYYFTPARIHVHPMYKYDYEVNVSHPIPVMYDLSVWAATYNFYGSIITLSNAVLCYRAASGWYEYASSIPRPGDLSSVVGYLFMKSYKRRPLPWYKYAVFTKSYVWPCPKSDWHWYNCIKGEYWGRFGFDSGGAMHMHMEGKTNRQDGLAAMCSFSLKLRSKQTTHYFTVIDTYPVLDFLYDAFLGLSKNVYLDDRFEDTKWAAPMAWWDEHIEYSYPYPDQHYQNPMRNFRR